MDVDSLDVFVYESNWPVAEEAEANEIFGLSTEI